MTMHLSHDAAQRCCFRLSLFFLYASSILVLEAFQTINYGSSSPPFLQQTPKALQDSPPHHRLTTQRQSAIDLEPNESSENKPRRQRISNVAKRIGDKLPTRFATGRKLLVERNASPSSQLPEEEHDTIEEEELSVLYTDNDPDNTTIPEPVVQNRLQRVGSRLGNLVPRKFFVTNRSSETSSESSTSVVPENPPIEDETSQEVLVNHTSNVNSVDGMDRPAQGSISSRIFKATKRIREARSSPEQADEVLSIAEESRGDDAFDEEIPTSTGRLSSLARRLNRLPRKLREKLALNSTGETTSETKNAVEEVTIKTMPIPTGILFGQKPTNLTNYTAIVTTTDIRNTSRIWGVAWRIKRLPTKLSEKLLWSKNETGQEPAYVVSNVDELRDLVLLQRIPLADIEFNTTPVNVSTTINHPVMRLIAERVSTNSTPGNRAGGDTAHLALAIEGGGMRGAVSAGMAAAAASLGMTDVFDSIYGSSAGCVVGAYMISRQMCVDVYTEVLPAAKSRFASRRRVMGNLGVGIVNDAVARLRDKNSNGESPPEVNNADNVEDTTADSSIPPEKKTSRVVSWMPSVIRGISQLKPYFKLSPGMNISFVLDGVMSEDYGLRPFDMESFRINDAKQPLKVVSSTVRGNELETVAFGSSEGDFWDTEEPVTEGPLDCASRRVRAVNAIKRLLRATRTIVAGVAKAPFRLLGKLRRREPEQNDDMKSVGTESGSSTPAGRKSFVGRSRRKNNEQRNSNKKTYIRKATECPDDPNKRGFFACIESSMLVPGAAGPPVKLLRSKHRQEAERFGVAAMTSTCFDAFCYESIPFRSAVEDGATHVLALRSRPEGCFIETKPAVYEKVVAPVYFRLNGLGNVAEFFSSGGSQYRYLEEVMTLDDGLEQGCAATESYSKGVKVPPTEILYGTDKDKDLTVDIDSWKRAHLLPVTLPVGTQELPALTQDKDEVVMAVREGYAAAFDMLAPIVGLDPTAIDGMRVAELMFPKREDDDVYVLETPVAVKGEVIGNYNREQQKERSRFVEWMTRKREARRKSNEDVRRHPQRAVALEVEQRVPDTKLYAKQDSLEWLEAETLLAALPGFQEGKLNHLAGGLRTNRTQV